MFNEEKPGIELKKCRCCGEAKPLSDYHCEKSRGGRLVAKCKKCANAQRSERYELAKAKGLIDKERSAQASRDHYSRAKERVLEASRQSYLRNKEKVLVRSAQWKRENRDHMAARMAQRRAKAAEADSYTKGDIQILRLVQKNLCAVCRCDLGNTHHVDHIVPLKLGGGNRKENIQLLCPTCNCQKGAKHPIDFMQQKGYLL